MSELDVWEIYEPMGGTFETQYSGRCAVDRNHSVKRGDTVTKIQYRDNPLLPVSGVACKSCTKLVKGYR